MRNGVTTMESLQRASMTPRVARWAPTATNAFALIRWTNVTVMASSPSAAQCGVNLFAIQEQ